MTSLGTRGFRATNRGWIPRVWRRAKTCFGSDPYTIDNVRGTHRRRGPARWNGSLQLLEQRIAARDLDLAGRFLDVELLHHAVLDQHGIAARTRAEPVARAVEGQIDRLGEVAVTIGQEGEHAGGGLLLAGVHDEHVIDRRHRTRVDALAV